MVLHFTIVGFRARAVSCKTPIYFIHLFSNYYTGLHKYKMTGIGIRPYCFRICELLLLTLVDIMYLTPQSESLSSPKAVLILSLMARPSSSSSSFFSSLMSTGCSLLCVLGIALESEFLSKGAVSTDLQRVLWMAFIIKFK